MHAKCTTYMVLREKELRHSYNNLKRLKDKVAEESEGKLPELVNVTERNVLSFRVLNNPLNSIPTLQIHTEKQEIKERQRPYIHEHQWKLGPE